MNSAAAGARASAPRAALLAFAALALLVAASVALLFYDQALKSQTPLVQRVGGRTHFRPLGPPGDREAHFHFEVTVVDVLDITVLSASSGRAVKVIGRHLHRREYRRFRLAWNGRTAAGTLAPPGTYLVSVHFERRDQTVVVPGLELHLEGPPG